MSSSEFKDSLLTSTAEQRENSQFVSEDSRPKKKFIKRAFSELGKGSLRSAIFALMASAMGTGLFNFPYIAQKCGLVSLIIFIAVGAIFSVVSMHMLMSVSLPRKIKTYNELAFVAYGPIMKRLCEFCVIVYSWGITVCFQVVFAKFIVQLSEQLFKIEVYQPGSETEFNHTGNLIRICANGVNILLNLIFIFKKDLYSLRFVTILGTLSVFYNGIVILLTAFTGFTYDVPNPPRKIYSIFTDQHDWSNFKFVNFDHPLDLLAGIAATVFCYVNHQMIFPMSQQLKKPTPKRLHKIFNRAHIAESIIYSIVGVMGYLLLSSETIQPVVLESITTMPMVIGKCLMLITLFFAVPLNMLPAREMIYEACEIQRSKRNHIILCLLLAASNVIVAITFQKVNSYFGLLGGTAGTLIAGTIPALAYLKLTERPMSDPRCIIVAIFYSIMTICGIVGAIVSVVA